MHHLILNPTAGHGKAQRVRNQIESELSTRNLPFVTLCTACPGHATQLARSIIQKDPKACIVAMGGDGTLCETANGLFGSSAVLMMVPCGTGNDFIRTLGLPSDPLEAFRVQLDSPMRTIDCGQMNDDLFLNVSGTGFDIEVLVQTERFKKYLRGLGAYLMGLFSAIRRFDPVKAKLTIDGVCTEGRFTIIEVANGQYFGSGMRVAPNADPSDGLFDVVYVDAVPRLRIPPLLPKFISGKHVTLPIAHVIRAREILIEAPRMVINMDGELRSVNRAHYRMLAGQLNICCP